MIEQAPEWVWRREDSPLIYGRDSPLIYGREDSPLIIYGREIHR